MLKKILCKESFESFFNFCQLLRALLWHSMRKYGFITESKETIEDQIKDRVFPFEEYPACELCGTNYTNEIIIVQDGSRIVECNKCGLWFTSPRIEEKMWIEYLTTINKRNIEFTENRIKYGVALNSNIKYSLPSWRKSKAANNRKILSYIENILERKLKRIHDVGCGVGFFIYDAKSQGIEATGNELNAYACKVMKEIYGLNVYNDILPHMNFEKNSIDAIVMMDYIEHSYHPLLDLKAANRFLKTKGIIYIETFHIDCREFENLKENWNMLFWNHVYHFSEHTLKNMVSSAGFQIQHVVTSYEDVNIKIVARKV